MRTAAWFVGAVIVLPACGNNQAPDADDWYVVHQDLPGALLSVWGTSARDVWTVGGDARDGSGPLVLHFDGDAWTRIPTSETAGNLWWVFGFAGGPIYAGGDGGMILRHDNGVFVRMETPGNDTVFGIWGASPDDLWAVGGASESTNGFAWRSSGAAWVPEPSVPSSVQQGASIWKVFGLSATDAWFVGSNGVALHWDGAMLSTGETGIGSSLFTVHGGGERYVAVGGVASGVIVEYDGTAWTQATPEPEPMGLTGVHVRPDGRDGVVVGQFARVYLRVDGRWQIEDHGLLINDDLHGAWIDDEGGVWAVGGKTFTYPLTDGVMIYRGSNQALIDGGGL